MYIYITLFAAYAAISSFISIFNKLRFITGLFLLRCISQAVAVPAEMVAGTIIEGQRMPEVWIRYDLDVYDNATDIAVVPRKDVVVCAAYISMAVVCGFSPLFFLTHEHDVGTPNSPGPMKYHALLKVWNLSRPFSGNKQELDALLRSVSHSCLNHHDMMRCKIRCLDGSIYIFEGYLILM